MGTNRKTHRQIMCRVRDYETLSPKWDVSVKSLPSELREHCRGGGKKSVKVTGDGGSQGTQHRPEA